MEPTNNRQTLRQALASTGEPIQHHAGLPRRMRACADAGMVCVGVDLVAAYPRVMWYPALNPALPYARACVEAGVVRVGEGRHKAALLVDQPVHRHAARLRRRHPAHRALTAIPVHACCRVCAKGQNPGRQEGLWGTWSLQVKCPCASVCSSQSPAPCAFRQQRTARMQGLWAHTVLPDKVSDGARHTRLQG